MNDDFTESYGYLSPDENVVRVPRVPDSVERTQNLLGIAAALDASLGLGPEIRTGVAAASVRNGRRHQGNQTPKARAIPSSGFSVPATRAMDFAPEFLSHSTPVLGNIGNRFNVLPKQEMKSHIGRKTVVDSGSPSSDADEIFRKKKLATPQASDLQQILDKVPLRLKQGFMDQIGRAANEIARDFASQKAFDAALDLDLTQDQTFDHHGAHIDSAGTTPPTSRGNDDVESASIDNSKSTIHSPAEPFEALALARVLGKQDDLASKQKHPSEVIPPLQKNIAESRDNKSLIRGLELFAEPKDKGVDQEQRIAALEAQVQQISLAQATLQQQVEILKIEQRSEDPIPFKAPDSPTIGGTICGEDPITEDTLTERQKIQYRKLQLHKVDDASDVEVRNILKCIMFTLAYSDFDRLPEKTQQLASFLHKLCKFMNAIHQELYGCMDVRPLDYMYKSDNDDGLEECLAGMASLIVKEIGETHKLDI